MNKIGVITGDIVSSSVLNKEERMSFLEVINKIVADLKSSLLLTIEFYRGDSFQIKVNKPQNALKVALLLRAGIISHTPPKSKQKWDVRLALGIGDISFFNKEIVLSDGVAFQLSGRALDKIGKRRLVIKTSWNKVNDEFNVSTDFVDTIFTNLNQIQAKVVYLALSDKGLKQSEIATRIDKLPQYISVLFKKTQLNAVKNYLKRYYDVICVELSK